jgi:hypothetical protein
MQASSQHSIELNRCEKFTGRILVYHIDARLQEARCITGNPVPALSNANYKPPSSRLGSVTLA